MLSRVSREVRSALALFRVSPALFSQENWPPCLHHYRVEVDGGHRTDSMVPLRIQTGGVGGGQ